MNKLEWRLLELFTTLRETSGFSLGVDEYQALLQALEGGFGRDRDSLAELCCALWIKSTEQKKIFNYHFDRLIPNPSSTETGVDEPNGSKLGLYLIVGGIFIVGVILVFIINPFQTINLSQTINPFKNIPSPPLLEKPLYLLLIFVIPFLFACVYTLRMKRSKLKLYLTLGETFIFVMILVFIINLFQTITDPGHDIPDPRNIDKNVELIIAIIITCLLICACMLPLLTVVKIDSWMNRKGVEPINDQYRNFSPPVTEEEISESEIEVGRTGVPHVKTENTFNPVAAYFPVNRRQMKQSWRYLRCLAREGPAVELDLIGTVNEIGKHGIFLNPVFVPGRINRTQLLLLIDQDGSMIPFRTISRFLVETALQGSSLGRAYTYYFHNCPTEYFYQDEARSLNEDIDTVLNQLNKLHTVALIFSDAGAVRGKFSQERYNLTSIFLERIRRKIRYIAWVNPMPKQRWVNTTAQEIAHLVPMFEINRQGFYSAISSLRGHYSNQ